MARTWNEFFFGTEEDRKKAREVLKEMRPDYERPGEKPKKAVIDRRPPWTGAQAAEARIARWKSEVQPQIKATRKAAEAERKAVIDRLTSGTGAQAAEAKKAAPKEKSVGSVPAKKKPVAAKKPSFRGNWVGAAPSVPLKSFQEATRKGRADEFTKMKMRPKKGIFSKKK